MLDVFAGRARAGRVVLDAHEGRLAGNADDPRLDHVAVAVDGRRGRPRREPLLEYAVGHSRGEAALVPAQAGRLGAQPRGRGVARAASASEHRAASARGALHRPRVAREGEADVREARGQRGEGGRDGRHSARRHRLAAQHARTGCM